MGAGSRDKRVARRCGVVCLGRCCEATTPCFCKCNDVGFVVVGEVVKCSNMLRGEHGAKVVGVGTNKYN